MNRVVQIHRCMLELLIYTEIDCISLDYVNTLYIDKLLNKLLNEIQFFSKSIKHIKPNIASKTNFTSYVDLDFTWLTYLFIVVSFTPQA